jgi:hypothetical protein
VNALVSGSVLYTETRSGVSHRDKDNPRAYSITTARVLVANRGVCDVTIPDTMRAPIEGESVDYLAEFSVFGGRLQARAVAVLEPATV